MVMASSVMVRERSSDSESIASTMYSTKLMPASFCSWFSRRRVRLKMMELMKSQPSRSSAESQRGGSWSAVPSGCCGVVGVDTESVPLLSGRNSPGERNAVWLAPIVAK